MGHLYFDPGHAPAKGQQKVLLATTAYENPDASYTASIQASREALTKAGIANVYLLLSGNCHVDDARNSVVKEFLASDCTDLVFLDADVSWQPADLVRLCGHDLDLVGGVYPKRDTSRAAPMPCRTLPGVTEPDADGLLEVDGLPTGFMRIRRIVLETLARDAAKWRSSDHDMLPIVFERGAPPGEERRSGDLFFCWKWRQTGGRIYADADLRLGHAAKVIVRDSLAASLRRDAGTTLRWVCDRIRAGTVQPDDFQEAVDVVDNRFGASAIVLAAAVMMARKSPGHIIETGSGLSTVLMAAAVPGFYVYCLENDPLHAEQVRRMAREAGVKNIGICNAPLVNGWYDLAEFAELPQRFALGFVDGPARVLGERLPFFGRFGHRCDVIVADDTDGAEYLKQIVEWCRVCGASLELQSGRLAVLRAAQSERNAA